MASSLYFKQSVIILDSTAAVGPTSGSFIVYGGFSAEKNSRVSGILSVTNSEESTSVASGALVVSGGVGIGKNLNVAGSSTTGSIYVSGGTLRIPVGDTSSRPSPAQLGYVRYNTTNSQYEGFGYGDQWMPLGGVIDSDQNTKILAELTPGSNDNNITFYNNGPETMRLTSAGNLGIGTSNPTYKLEVNGSIGGSSLEIDGGVTLGSLFVTGSSTLHLGASAGSLYVTGSSILQGSVTAGALYVTGGDLILSGTGGSMFYSYSDGSGVSVAMAPNKGDIIQEKSFVYTYLSSANVTNVPVTGLSFNNSYSQAFNAIVTIIVDHPEDTNKYTTYEVKGLQKENEWVVNTSFIGDQVPLNFSITSLGQIEFSSNFDPAAQSTKIYFSFRAETIKIITLVA